VNNNDMQTITFWTSENVVSDPQGSVTPGW